MRLSRIATAFDHADFLFEWKADGFRSLVYLEQGYCELVSRKRNHYKSFNGLKAALAKLKVKDAILDGELCCLDSEGRSLFNELLYRRAEPVFYCFDLLWLNGHDLRQLALVERKRRLRQLVAKNRCERLIFAQHIAKHGTALYREICERDLEGIVCKRKDGAYSSAGQWLKVLNPNYTQHSGRHEKFTAFKERSSRALR